MRLLQKPLLRISLAMGIVLAAVTTTAVSPDAACAACGNDEGIDDVILFGGFAKEDTFGGSTLAIKADLYNYNPYRVWQDTSFSVNLGDSTYIYAQVGWGKNDDEGDEVEYVFSEYDNGIGPPTRMYYDAEADEWTGTKATEPSSSKTYKVTWIDDGPDKQVQIKYDDSTTQNITVPWTPDVWNVLGETHNFRSDTPKNDGDHAPGDTTNKIHADTIQFYEYEWDDVSGYSTVEQGNMDTDTTDITDVGFRIWDIRCAD